MIRNTNPLLQAAVTIAFAFVSLARAETSFSTSCFAGSPVSAFPGCNAFLNTGEKCGAVRDRPGKQACLCNQSYLDSLARYEPPSCHPFL